MVHGYYNRVRQLNHKNENPRLCAQNNILILFDMGGGGMMALPECF